MMRFLKNKVVLALLFSILLIGIFFVTAIQQSITFELGDSVDVQSLKRFPIGHVVLENEYSFQEVGSYHVEVKYLFLKYNSNIIIEDTVAPIGEGVDIELSYKDEIIPGNLVSNIFDLSSVNVYIDGDIDYTTDDKQEIIIRLQDEFSNESLVTSYITLDKDEVAPVIDSVSFYESKKGESISYRNLVNVSDDSGKDVILDIDNSNVDVDTLGTYSIFYTATDLAGNSATKEVKLTIYEVSAELELVEQKAREILAQITTDDMTLEEKAIVIHSWVRSNVKYRNGVTSRDGWIAAAYQGFFQGIGDCYIFAATQKILLTEAGIPNIDMTIMPTTFEHYWSIVDVGYGWVHLDAVYRSDGTMIVLWTNEQIKAYAKVLGSNSHNYDPTLYPEIN